MYALCAWAGTQTLQTSRMNTCLSCTDAEPCWRLPHALCLTIRAIPTCPHCQVMDVLSRLSICERASIDECYLDVSAEAARRLAAASGHPQPPVNADRIHVAGQA